MEKEDDPPGKEGSSSFDVSGFFGCAANMTAM